MGNGDGAARVADVRVGAGLEDQPGWLEFLHLGGLWTVAVAQPLFDLLGRSPEFFVAHDTRPGDLLGLVILLCLAGPACWLPALRIGRLSGPRSHALAMGVAVGALAAAFVLAAVKQATDWNRDLSFAVAAIGGVLFASMYLRVVTIRLFATLLSPAAVVAPALFLAQPGIRPLLSGDEAGPAPLRTVAPDRPRPVVVVVFDQLPLISLLDRDGGVDRALYPSFAALADEATWFRNASAVSGWTASALPAILTGNYPRPGRLPTADHHPANLFTLLGPHYALHVAEPLTDLCPETLCPLERDGTLAGYGRVLTDLAIVYLHAALPDEVAADLPPVTQSWRDFAPADDLFGRWNTRRDRDRGRTATDFIGEIGAATDGGPPPLHFLHVLLPHEPWVHLPTGQRYALRPRIVAAVRDHWLDDAWAVTREYQRHLLQVQFVDTLLGKLLRRLRAVGLYDDALLVVTADHGASLRPGRPFRLPTADTFADVAAVPLLVKRPGQRRGRVSIANVETIDILPTVAAEIGLRPPRQTDGSNVFSAGRKERPAKRMFLYGGHDRLHGPADLGEAVAEGVSRKLERFASGDPAQPLLGVHDDIVGLPVADLQAERPAGFEVIIEESSLLRDVDRDGEFLPAHITGGVIGHDPSLPVPPLAVSVNGVVAAVTRAYPFGAFGHATPWDAIIDPRRLVAGANDLRVFAIREGRSGTVMLEEASDAGALRYPLDLLPETAERTHGVISSGFLPTQSTGYGDLRWTTGAARLSAPLDPRSPPAALTVRLLTTGPQKRLQVVANGCTLFEGPVFGRWDQTFPLEGCLSDSASLAIELRSNVHLSREESGLRLGVGVAAIELRDDERQ